MPDLISVCIPTRNRPELLYEAVESCLAQAYRPLEIVIGDDSTDERTQAWAARIELPEGVTVRYVRNTPPLGQSGNVNSLFQRASGGRLMLLHDDDSLMPKALDRLVDAWDEHTDVAAVYGKRYFTTQEGEILHDRTQMQCKRFYMTADYEGPQESAIVAALRQQIANDAYLVRTDLAQSVGYRPAELVGRMVDWDFGVRLGLAAEPSKFIYIDEFTVKYRLSKDSIARSGKERPNYHLMYENFLRLEIPPNCKANCKDVFARLTEYALRGCIDLHDRRRAFQIYFSPDYAVSRLSPRGLYYLFSIVFPQIKYLRDRLWIRFGI